MSATNTKIVLNELDNLKSEAKFHPYTALGNLINMTNIYPCADIDESIVDSDIAPRLDLMLNIKHRLINDLNNNYYTSVIRDADRLNKLNDIRTHFVIYNEIGEISKINPDTVLEVIDNVQYNLLNHN